MLTPGQARDLVAHFGSQKGAARAIGVAPNTFLYWLDPETTKRRMARLYAADPERKLAANREHYWTRDGIAHSRHQLQKRRSQALIRRAQRNQRRAA